MTAVVTPTAAVAVVNPTVIIDGGLIVAVCTLPVVAARLAQLWDRHGATDVPDTVEGVGE